MASPIEIYRTPFLNHPNLQGYWRLNGNFTDSSVNGYTLTGSGTPGDVQGIFGDTNGAKSFASASSQYAKIANASCPNLNITGPQTWIAWIYPTAFNNNGRIMSKADGTNTANRHDFYITSSIETPARAVTFQLSGLTTNNSIQTSANVVSTGKWQFVASRYDGANLSIWVNGEIVAMLPATGSANSSTAAFWMAAAGFGGGDTASDLADMYMDEAQVYNTGLSNNEIWQIYNGSASFRSGDFRRWF